VVTKTHLEEVGKKSAFLYCVNLHQTPIMIKIKTSITDINVQYFIDNEVYDNDTKNRIYDWEEFFRSRLILNLNELFGDDWHLDFIQTPEKYWQVDVFCDDLDTARQIKEVITSAIDDFQFEVFFNNKAI
jgi:hypothetical protein